MREDYVRRQNSCNNTKKLNRTHRNRNKRVQRQKLSGLRVFLHNNTAQTGIDKKGITVSPENLELLKEAIDTAIAEFSSSKNKE
jgi:hypothetical protein